MQFNQLRHTARLATQHVMKSQVATSIISGPANMSKTVDVEYQGS